MRVIKFRAWGEVEMVYEGGKSLDYIHSWNILREYEVLMQFIGLKDKNGIEIYEGDILKSSTKEAHYFEVYYSDGGFKYRNKSKTIDISFADHNHLEKILSILEVVGNIYETPEILK